MRLHNYRRLYTTRWDLMCNVVIWRRWLCFSSQRSATATATTTTPPPLTKKAELTPRRLRWGLTHIIIYLFIYFTPSVALELFCKGNTEYSPKKPDAHSHHHYAHAHTHTIVVSQPHARAHTHTTTSARTHTRLHDLTNPYETKKITRFFCLTLSSEDRSLSIHKGWV